MHKDLLWYGEWLVFCSRGCTLFRYCSSAMLWFKGRLGLALLWWTDRWGRGSSERERRGAA